jgi:hypothetical protein
MLLIGSAAGVHVRLKSPRVSAMHAAVLFADGAWWLFDLASDDGTQINGACVREARLGEGDTLQFGPFRFRYSEAGPAGVPPLPPAANNVPPKAARLTITRPDGKSATVPMVRRALIVGSKKGCDLTLGGDGIAPVHALVYQSAGHHVIRRLAPQGEIRAGVKNVVHAALRPGEAVSIHGFQIRYETAARTAQTSQPPPPPEPEPKSAAPAVLQSAVVRVAPQREAPRASHATVSETVAAAPDIPAPPSPRLKPVVGRRARTVPPPPISVAPIAGPSAELPARSDVSAEEAEPDADGSRLGLFLLMLVCMAGASVAIWRVGQPPYLVRGSITFVDDNTRTVLLDRRPLLADQEGRLTSGPVLDSAAKRLSGPTTARSRPAQVRFNLGFLARPDELARRATLNWQASPTSANRATLTLSLRSVEPVADAARLGAMLNAFYESRLIGGDAGKPATRPSSGQMKLDLLRTEVDDLKQEIAYRHRQASQVAAEVRTIEASVPSTQRLELMKRRETTLQAALDAAVESRVRAEMRLNASSAATRPAATTSLATNPPAAASDRRALEDARAEEAKARAELTEALKERADVEARAERLSALQQRMKLGQGELPSLEHRLAQKTGELDQAQSNGPESLRILPPGDPQVTRDEDKRPLWIAVALAVIAVTFGGFMAVARRGNGADESPPPSGT